MGRPKGSKNEVRLKKDGNPAKRPGPKIDERGICTNSKYDPKYCKELIDYFKSHNDETSLPFFERFAINIGVCKDTIYEWGKVHPDFSDALKKAKEIQELLWKERSLANKFQPAFTIFLGKNVFKWKDKQDHVVNTDGELTSLLREISENNKPLVKDE